MNDVATGLSTCILKDGTQTTTAAVPFAFGITIPVAQLAPTFAVITRQPFLSGSAATYTTPANVRQLRIRMKGGGGGGCGTGTGGSTANGGTGGTTIFNSVNANGGVGGNSLSTGNPGAGGTGGTGTASFRLSGASGGNFTRSGDSATNCSINGGDGGGQ